MGYIAGGAGVAVGGDDSGGGSVVFDARGGAIGFVEVLEALEGELAPVVCTHDGKCCHRRVACERKTGWQTLHKELYNLLKSKTLADVLRLAAKS